MADFLRDHARLISRTGGTAGVRDQGLLESALGRPRHKHAYEGADLAACTAAYLYGIVMNHPFHDGNKRAGLLAAIEFLARNGHRLDADSSDVLRIVIRVASGEFDESDLTDWFVEHMRADP